METEQIVAEINKKRAEMINIGMEKGIKSVETVNCSQELDNLLNHYRRLLSESNT
jgi:hypothetical protein